MKYLYKQYNKNDKRTMLLYEKNFYMHPQIFIFVKIKNRHIKYMNLVNI